MRYGFGGVTDELTSALERLYRRRRFGVKLGLEVEEALLRRLGDPHRSFLAVHVAGTNGKGSVCAMLDAVLREAGYPTGRYTSPHLVRFHERFRAGGACIGDAELLELVRTVEAAAAEVADEVGQRPTFFECSTAIAFAFFRQQGVKIGVVEVGMGGRLDATNVVTPLLSVITRVGLDHTAYLGSDLASIAGEKAGIVKAGRPVVTGAQEPEALATIRAVCRQRGCPLLEAPAHASLRRRATDLGGQKVSVETAEEAYGTLHVPLLGEHQVENLATAVTALDALRSALGTPIEAAAVSAGLARVQWAGRCSVLKRDPPVILDGAHNEDAARALAAALADLLPGKPVGLVLGMCGDKDVGRFLARFRGAARRLWVVPIDSARCMDPAAILSAAASAGIAAEARGLAEALAAAERWALAENGVVCVTGSLFLAGKVLSLS